MNISLPKLSVIGSAIRAFLWRYNITVFLVPAIGALSLATFLLYGVIQTASATPTDASTTVTFDKDTMELIKKLQPATSLDTYSLPSNQRSNPFAE